ncbi:hypothetical protein FQZ97_879600 [compost metagenome]
MQPCVRCHARPAGGARWCGVRACRAGTSADASVSTFLDVIDGRTGGLVRRSAHRPDVGAASRRGSGLSRRRVRAARIAGCAPGRSWPVDRRRHRRAGRTATAFLADAARARAVCRRALVRSRYPRARMASAREFAAAVSEHRPEPRRAAARIAAACAALARPAAQLSAARAGCSDRRERRRRGRGARAGREGPRPAPDPEGAAPCARQVGQDRERQGA